MVPDRIGVVRLDRDLVADDFERVGVQRFQVLNDRIVVPRVPRVPLAVPPDPELLHRSAGGRGGGSRGVEQRLGRLAAIHAVGHGIGQLLVAIAGLADAAGDLHARALLNDVRGLVRGHAEGGRRRERNVLADRKGLGAHGP